MRRTGIGALAALTLLHSGMAFATTPVMFGPSAFEDVKQSAPLVRKLLKEIAEKDASASGLPGGGAPLRSVLVVNPNALKQAEAVDARRNASDADVGIERLFGVPILIKDNIETAELPTTAGSLALKDNRTGRDAPVVARLRAAGMVVLGKTNLSEWANIRSSESISGWSAVGGLVRNPYSRDRTACGSSGGSAVAVAAGLAPAAVGTETNGSITCPAAVNGVVGLKPTVGLVSRSRIVPISHTQDTAGPITRTVAEAAALLTAMAGSDPADPATQEADARKADYLAALKPGALKGVRLGVLRYAAGFNPQVDAVFEAALATLKAQGAELVEVKPPEGLATLGRDQLPILLGELKTDLNAYLKDAAPGVKARTLKDLIAFNAATPAETPLFGQELFERSEATEGTADPAYLKARAGQQKARELLNAMVADNKVAALVAPTLGPAWSLDPALGDSYQGGGAGLPPAMAGYPHLTVPMGQVRGLPVGLSFIGTAWTETTLLNLGHAYEQARGPLPGPPSPRAWTRRCSPASTSRRAEPCGGGRWPWRRPWPR